MTNKEAMEIIKRVIGCESASYMECMDEELCDACQYHHTQKELIAALKYALEILEEYKTEHHKVREELAKIIDVHLIMNECENKIDAYDIADDILANGYTKQQEEN